MRRAGPVAVWTVWAIATILAIVWVIRYGRHFPYSDEWRITERLVGDRPPSFGWLWSPTAEVHRPIVPRLAVYTFAKASGGDFVLTIWLDLILLSAVAAAAIVVMRRTRGVTRITDAIFPLLLLSLVQPALRWGFEINHVLVAVVSVSVLLIMVRYGIQVPARWLWVAVAMMSLLLGVGAPGLATLPGLLIWAVVSAWQLRSRSLRSAVALLAAVGAMLLVAGLYFMGLPGSSAESRSVRNAPEWMLRLVGVLASPRGDELWPLTGVVILAGGLVTVGLLAVRFVKSQPGTSERGLTIALTCFGLSAVGVLAALAVGRSGYYWNPDGAVAYLALAIPLPCWVYVTWDRLSPRFGTWFGALVLAIVVGAYALAADFVPRQRGDDIRAEADFKRDYCTLSPERLVRRYPNVLLESPSPAEERLLQGTIAEMRRDGFGPYDCDEEEPRAFSSAARQTPG